MLSCLRMRAPAACTSACATVAPSMLPPKKPSAAEAEPQPQPPRRRLHAIYNLKSKRNASSALPPTPESTKTSLYDFHVEHGGKMVPFAGFLLPIQYNNDPVLASHVHTRTKGCASLFDVSHMLQTTIRGRDKDVLLETLTPADVKNLRPGAATLTVFTDPLTGGILDDLVASRTHEDTLFIVSNAGRRQHDSALLARTAQELSSRGMDVSVEFHDPKDFSLLALQGNGAADALSPLVEGVDLPSLYFMQTARATVNGIPVRITRCGYTGEDGFEIAVPSDCARSVADALLRSKAGNVRLAGLGARDSLRLEAGLCLYGVDLDHTTTPVEAGLTWLIAKRRREEADFPGASVILKQIRDGPARKRVGLTPLERGPPARANTAIYAQGQEDGDPVGHVTSGSPSPTLNTSVAMGYVRTPYAKVGTEVRLLVRDKYMRHKVSKMPFVPTQYYSAPKPA